MREKLRQRGRGASGRSYVMLPIYYYSCSVMGSFLRCTRFLVSL